MAKSNNRQIVYLWPEDNAPENVKECKRCELCKHKSRVIWGEGNRQGKVIVILDNPGRREDKEGIPFVCGVRETMQMAAHDAGFNQNDLYVTYIVKCKPKRAYDKVECRNACIEYLEQQLHAHNYLAAFCLGDTAVKSFFNDQGKSVKYLREAWYQIRGLPTYVSYHPFMVRRRPGLYPYFVKDWKEVKKFICSP